MDVMVVEDDRLQRSRLAKLCGQHPHAGSIFVSGSATDALVHLDEARFDLVLIEVDLPDMSGVTLARKIVAAYPDTLCAFVTADKDSAYEAFQLGAIDYMLKPYRDEQVREVLDKADRAIKARTSEP